MEFGVLIFRGKRIYTLELEFFLNLRLFTPLIASKFEQKYINEKLNQDLGIHLDNFLDLFTKLNVPKFKKSEDNAIKHIKPSAQEIIETLENNKNDLITEEVAEDIIHELNFNQMTDYTLLKHQKQGLIWILERENFYDNYKSGTLSGFQGFSTKNLKNYLNPLWSEYCIRRDLRCSSKNIGKVNKKILKSNQKNKFLKDKFYFYYHKMTGQMTLEFPDVGCHINFYGGLLADEMGLGKTILMLSLIGISKMFSNSHQMGLLKNFNFTKTDKKAKIIEQVSKGDFFEINKQHKVFKIKSKSKGRLKPTGNAKKKVKRSKTKPKKKKNKRETWATLGGNLIIVPTILMAQWEDEINSFFKKVNRVITRGL